MFDVSLEVGFCVYTCVWKNAAYSEVAMMLFYACIFYYIQFFSRMNPWYVCGK